MRAKVRAPAPVRVVWDGQSHNLWPPTFLYDHLGPIPNRTMANLGIPWANVAVGNLGWQDRDPAPMVSLARNRPGCTDILFMNGGQADIYVKGNNAAQAYSRALLYAAAARAAGYSKIVGVTFPVTVLIAPAEITAYNTLMRASGAFDALADLGAHFTDYTDRHNYETDQTHFTAVGAAKAARVTHTALKELL